MNTLGRSSESRIHGWYMKPTIYFIRAANAFMNSVTRDPPGWWMSRPPRWYPEWIKSAWLESPPKWMPLVTEVSFLYFITVGPVFFRWCNVWLLYIGTPTLIMLNILRRMVNKRWPHILTPRVTRRP